MKNKERILETAVRQMKSHLRAGHYGEVAKIARNLSGIMRRFEEEKREAKFNVRK